MNKLYSVLPELKKYEKSTVYPTNGDDYEVYHIPINFHKALVVIAVKHYDNNIAWGKIIITSPEQNEDDAVLDIFKDHCKCDTLYSMMKLEIEAIMQLLM